MASSPAEPDHLSQLALFRGVPAWELERLTLLLHRKIFPAGSTVLTTDQPGDVVYIIISGGARVHVI